MKHLLRKCTVCNRYTLKSKCSFCLVDTIDPKPAKFSPEDKYLKYRVSDYYSKNPNSF